VKAKKIIKDNNQPSHCMFTPLSSRRRGQQVHQSWDRETEKQLLSQGHQIVKTATTNIEWLLSTY
jgi:hypothetical protein